MGNLIPIPIVFEEHRVTATGSSVKFVTCANCGCEYLYRLVCQGTGSDSNVLFLDNTRAKSKAEEHARKNLERALATRCEPVPCPACGWFQTDMVVELRRRHLRWMWYWAYGLAVLSFFTVATSPHIS